MLALHRRWGQGALDAKPYSSYTEEEFHRAMERWKKTGSPEIFAFFKHIDPAWMADPGPQLEKVLDFRKSLEDSRQVLYRFFADDNAFVAETAAAYGNLGLIYRTRGELDRAEAMHQQSLAINEKLGHQEGMANQHSNLGSIAKDRGNIARARELWAQARDLYAKIGMPHRVEMVQGWLDGLPPG